jgi:hypothetical protein
VRGLGVRMVDVGCEVWSDRFVVQVSGFGV